MVEPTEAEPAEPHTLMLRDEGGVALTEYLRTHTLSVPQTLRFTLGVARILAGVHKARAIHKDIGPANLLIHPETLAPTLIDFNIAGEISQAEAAADVQTGIARTLSYMSPEQTGRTGRAPDQRSDLYSLGITLYELLTGHKPFESTDLLELVHDHLVRVPEPPITRNPEIAQITSDLVMRLLEKEPSRRYQSADGLAQDLSRIHPQHALHAGPVRFRHTPHPTGQAHRARDRGASRAKPWPAPAAATRPACSSRGPQAWARPHCWPSCGRCWRARRPGWSLRNWKSNQPTPPAPP